MSHQQKVYPRQSIALDRARAGACTIETATTESLPAGIGVATEVPQSTGRKRRGATPRTKATGSRNESGIPNPAHHEPQPVLASIDNDALAIPKERYHRDKAHLKFVASQPCLICERSPSDAHHLRFTQPRAMGRKVSDEFTVPLCIALATNRPGGQDRPLIPSRRRESSGPRQPPNWLPRERRSHRTL